MSVDGPLSGETAELRVAIMSVFPSRRRRFLTAGVFRRISLRDVLRLSRVCYTISYIISLFLCRVTAPSTLIYIAGQDNIFSGFMYLIYIVRDLSYDFICLVTYTHSPSDIVISGGRIYSHDNRIIFRITYHNYIINCSGNDKLKF